MNDKFCGHCVCGDHAWAVTSKGYVTLVSPQDDWLIKEFSWRANVDKPKSAFPRVYATTKSRGPHATRRDLHLHREVMECRDDPRMVDHVNHWCTDNRRGNLRLCTQSQNQANRCMHRNGYAYSNGFYVVKIRHNGQRYYLGNFKTKEEAHAVYVAKAKELFGDFSNLDQSDLAENPRITGKETNDRKHRKLRAVSSGATGKAASRTAERDIKPIRPADDIITSV